MPGCWERNEFFFLKEIIYFWLFCVFVAAHGLPLFAATGAALWLGLTGCLRSGFSHCVAQVLGRAGSVAGAHRL